MCVLDDVCCQTDTPPSHRTEHRRWQKIFRPITYCRYRETGQSWRRDTAKSFKRTWNCCDCSAEANRRDDTVSDCHTGDSHLKRDASGAEMWPLNPDCCSAVTLWTTHRDSSVSCSHFVRTIYSTVWREGSGYFLKSLYAWIHHVVNKNSPDKQYINHQTGTGNIKINTHCIQSSHCSRNHMFQIHLRIRHRFINIVQLHTTCLPQ